MNKSINFSFCVRLDNVEKGFVLKDMVNPLQSGFTFLYRLKTSENLKVF